VDDIEECVEIILVEDDTPLPEVIEEPAEEPLPAKQKPREIVVVGSKVRSDDKHKQWIDILSAQEEQERPLLTPVESSDELEVFAQALTLTDDNIKEIHVTLDTVEMTYTRSARFLGIFPYTYDAVASVDKEGRVNIQFPWQLVISSDDKAEVEDAITDLVASPEAGMDVQHTIQRHQARLQLLSNIMKTR